MQAKLAEQIRRRLMVIIKNLKFDKEKIDLQDLYDSRFDSLPCIMVAGCFSVGKSSFINAIFQKNVATVKATATTAIITRFVYGEQDEIRVYFKDNTIKIYTEENFARLTSEADEWNQNHEDKNLREKIQFVERSLPIELLKSCTIIDSPGLNSNNLQHNQVTIDYYNQADIIIWLLSATQPASAYEVSNIRKLPAHLKTLVLVNKMDLVDDEEDTPEDIIADVKIKLGNIPIAVMGISSQYAFMAYEHNDSYLWYESNFKAVYAFIEKIGSQIAINRNKSFVEQLSKIMESILQKKDSFDEQNICNKQDICISENEYRDYINKKYFSIFLEDILKKAIDLIYDVYEYQDEIILNDESRILLSRLFKEQDIHYKRFNKVIPPSFIAAMNESGEAQYAMGEFCQQKFRRNCPRALYWFKLASANGVHLANTKLINVMEEDGNTEAALEWYEEAAKYDEQAVIDLALILYEGKNNVQPRPEEAIQWLKKAIKTKRVECEKISYYLGREYLIGRFIKKNETQALILIDSSAQKGYLPAMKLEADCFYNGIGTSMDRLAAFKLFYRCFEKENHIEILEKIYTYYVEDNYEMQIVFGDNYRYGNNEFSKDLKKALFWYKIAFKHSRMEASKRILSMFFEKLISMEKFKNF